MVLRRRVPRRWARQRPECGVATTTRAGTALHVRRIARLGFPAVVAMTVSVKATYPFRITDWQSIVPLSPTPSAVFASNVTLPVLP